MIRLPCSTETGKKARTLDTLCLDREPTTYPKEFIVEGRIEVRRSVRSIAGSEEQPRVVPLERGHPLVADRRHRIEGPPVAERRPKVVVARRVAVSIVQHGRQQETTEEYNQHL